MPAELGLVLPADYREGAQHVAGPNAVSGRIQEKLISVAVGFDERLEQ